MGFFSDLFGTGGAATDAANQKIAGLNLGYQQASDFFGQGRGALTTGATAAQNVLNPIVGQTGAGAGLYADLTGANGPEGQARARAAFQTDPGYQFTRDEALQATQRATGTGGMQGSGNVLTALQDRAAGLASQQYGNWASRLAPYIGATGDLTKALAATYGAAGGDITTQGNALANLYYGADTGIANAGAAALTGAQSATNALGGQIIKIGGDLAGKLLGYATGQPAKP